MRKMAVFCDMCGRHVGRHNSISFHIIPDMSPILAVRGKTDEIEDGDITLCEFCEKEE